MVAPLKIDIIYNFRLTFGSLFEWLDIHKIYFVLILLKSYKAMTKNKSCAVLHRVKSKSLSKIYFYGQICNSCCPKPQNGRITWQQRSQRRFKDLQKKKKIEKDKEKEEENLAAYTPSHSYS